MSEKNRCLDEGLSRLFSGGVPQAEPVRFQKGELIYWEGREPDRCYYIAQGRAALGANGLEGRHAVFCILPAPAFFGELELLSVQPVASEVTAFTDCFGYCFHTEEIRLCLRQDLQFLQFLCRYLSERTVLLSRKLMRMQTVPLTARLAEYILETETDGLYRCPDREAAAYLGASKRRVAALMGELRRRGLLKKSGQHDFITDSRGLRRAALLK